MCTCYEHKGKREKEESYSEASQVLQRSCSSVVEEIILKVSRIDALIVSVMVLMVIVVVTVMDWFGRFARERLA